MAEPVKMIFELEIDEDEEWPPAGTEGIWVEPLGNNRYKVDNAPFFAFGIACDDIVSGVEEDGRLYFDDHIESGGHCTIRIIPLADGPMAGTLQPVIDMLEPYGVWCEGAEPAWMILSVDVGPDVDLPSLKALLNKKSEDGTWAYEEGCSTPEWIIA